MAYSGVQQNIIDINALYVKRWGHCDFEEDPNFDPNTEQIIEMDFAFNPSIWEYYWYWNGSTFELGDAIPNRLFFYEAERPPSSSDDKLLGFQKSCAWIDISEERSYFCIDNAADAAVWEETSNNGILAGLQFYPVEDVRLSETTSCLWRNKLALNITDLPAHMYMISWSAELSCSKNKKAVGIAVVSDLSKIALGRLTIVKAVDWLPVAGHGIINWPGGDLSVKMNYCLLPNLQPAEIEEAEIISPYSISAKYIQPELEKKKQTSRARARIRNARIVLWRTGP